MLGVPQWFTDVQDIGVKSRYGYAESDQKKLPLPAWRWVGRYDELITGALLPVGEPGPDISGEDVWLPALYDRNTGALLKDQVLWPVAADKAHLRDYDPPYAEFGASGDHVYHWSSIVLHMQTRAVWSQREERYVVYTDNLADPSGEQPRPELWDELSKMALDADQNERQVIVKREFEKGEQRKLAILENMLEDKKGLQQEDTMQTLRRSLSGMANDPNHAAQGQESLPKALWLYDTTQYPDDMLPDSSSSGGWSSSDVNNDPVPRAYHGGAGPSQPAGPVPTAPYTSGPPPPPQGIYTDGSTRGSRVTSRRGGGSTRGGTGRRDPSPDPAGWAGTLAAQMGSQVWTIFFNERAIPTSLANNTKEYMDYDEYRKDFDEYLKQSWLAVAAKPDDPPEGYIGGYWAYSDKIAAAEIEVNQAILEYITGVSSTLGASEADVLVALVRQTGNVWNLNDEDKARYERLTVGAIDGIGLVDRYIAEYKLQPTYRMRQRLSNSLMAYSINENDKQIMMDKYDVAVKAHDDEVARQSDPNSAARAAAGDAAALRLAQQPPGVVRRGKQKAPPQTPPTPRPVRLVQPTPPTPAKPSPARPTRPTTTPRQSRLAPPAPPEASSSSSSPGDTEGRSFTKAQWGSLPDLEFVDNSTVKIPSIYGDRLLKYKAKGGMFYILSILE